MLGRQHQHQGATIAQHQQVGQKQENAQVRPEAIHIAEHPRQGTREVTPLHRGQHPGIGPQGIAEKAARPGIGEPLPVGRFRLLAALGQIQAPPGLAIPSIKQVPAVGHQLQPVLQCHQGRVGLPGEGASYALGTLLGRLGLELLRTQRPPAVAAAGAARVAARQRGWSGWGLLPGGMRSAQFVHIYAQGHPEVGSRKAIVCTRLIKD